MRASNFEKCSELNLICHHQFYSERSYSVAQQNYFNVLFELTGDLTYGNIGSMVTFKIILQKQLKNM